jgi:hypothetical protein
VIAKKNQVLAAAYLSRVRGMQRWQFGAINPKDVR